MGYEDLKGNEDGVIHKQPEADEVRAVAPMVGTGMPHPRNCVVARSERMVQNGTTMMGINSRGAGGLFLLLCAFFGVRRLVPQAFIDSELGPDLFGQHAAGAPPVLLGENSREVAPVGLQELGGGVHGQAATRDGSGRFNGSAIHETAPYCRVAALSSGRKRDYCQVTVLRPLTKAMATAKKPKARVSVVAPGWEGFGRRFRHALESRCADWGVSENEIARRSHLNSGAFSRAKGGRVGTGANTVMLLARALYVRLTWLLEGNEPSGLSEFKADPGPPDKPARATGS
jgi:hypothetical protein